jgi:hypothetical protein
VHDKPPVKSANGEHSRPGERLASLGRACVRLYRLGAQGEAHMLRWILTAALIVSIHSPAVGDGMNLPRHRHYRQFFYLAPERHVVEVVQPPWSGNFIINGTRFTGRTPACFSWAAGERIALVAGDWRGRCVEAVFYNFARRSTCETWCR